MRSRITLRVFAVLLAMVACCAGPACASTPVSAATPPDTPLGLHTTYFKESGSELGIADAVAAYRSGKFVAGDSPVLDFGIGSRPVWIGFEVGNETGAGLLRRLAVETSWLDRVDVYILAGGNVVASSKMGDAQPFPQRPIDGRFFDVDHVFAPGISEVFIRIETHDPMVVPIYLRSIGDAIHLEVAQDYSYGLVYGFLLALMAYNAMLYVGLRSRRYIYYSIYLAVFLLLNIAYTGHGFAWLWPEQVRLQLWIIPFAMWLYGTGGLLFAVSFLDTRHSFPRMHRAIFWLCATFGVLMSVLFLLGQNALHMVAAFVFIALFSPLMLWLGALAVRAGYKPARYFLYGAVASMTGALLTDLSVAGLVPFNELTYRSVEIGMMLDAVFLALALAYQFRSGQNDKLVAERMARIDPLTGMNNRRAFHEITRPIWSNALRNRRDVAVILLDVDHFKQINDNYGHAAGDEVLIAIAFVLTHMAREGDVTARWGGEEFLLFLPETNLDSAIALAERLRVAISEKRVQHAKGAISFTASFGVAQRAESCTALEELTSLADRCLYRAKHEGRNRVSHTELPSREA
jgi:diguanylate cyclase (GGDEF)-like protein